VKVIENANVIISTYEATDMGASQQVDPVQGTVCFGSAKFGWGFTLTRFAKVYASKFKISRQKMMEKLWGENYFDKEAKKWKKNPVSDSGAVLPRAFNQFIMDLIIKLARNIMEDNREAVDKMLSHLDITLKAEEQEKVGKDLFKCVFQKWINSADMLLEMIITKLPSPKTAQAYRAGYLYEGDINDPCGQAIQNCDPTGPLMVYISKMVPTKEKGRFYAFGRVFSGTVTTGQRVRIMGPKFEFG
jgi:elongation factor 2